MNSNNLRKRRSYDHDDAPVVSIPHHPTPGPSLSDCFTGQELHILRQAQSIIKCSDAQLLALYHYNSSFPPHLIHPHHQPHAPQHQHQQEQQYHHHHQHHANHPSHPHPHQQQKHPPAPHQPLESHLGDDYSPSPILYQATNHKRLRLTTDVTGMSSQDEKSSPLGASRSGIILHKQDPDGVFSLDVDGSRLAQCFSSCMSCGTTEPPVYSQIPVTSSPYGYVPTLPPSLPPYCDEKPATPSGLPVTVPNEQPKMYPGEDAGAVPAAMSNYPVLQPGRPGIQTTVASEGMVYPGVPSSQGYLGPPQSAAGGIVNHVTGHQSGAHQFDHTEEVVRRESGASAFMSPDNERVDIKTQPGELTIVLPNQRGGGNTKRGPFKSTKAREETATTRKMGSCIRCRMQRIRCEINEHDTLGPCLTCNKVSNAKIWRLPCLRYKITDVKLFKPGQVKGYEWTRRWTEGDPGDISQWASQETRFVQITEGFTNQPIRLRVRQFVPQEGDALDRTWVHNGQKRQVRIPAFAIVNLVEAKQAYDNYIRAGVRECCRTILERKEKMLYATYRVALRTATDPNTPAKERDLLTKALQLWMAVRLTTKSTVIVGDETLGMAQDIMDDTSPLAGKIPLPPVMGAQIELVLIHQIQSSLRREMLENLQAMTQANKHQTWFTTYLVTFILLHNVSLLCQHDAGYARKHGLKRRFAREEMVREYQLGANILLAYFHYCNKGIYPFSAECKPQDLSNLAELDDTKAVFVGLTRQAVNENRSEWAKVRENEDYENDFYFISQLYEENWMPQASI